MRRSAKNLSDDRRSYYRTLTLGQLCLAKRMLMNALLRSEADANDMQVMLEAFVKREPRYFFHAGIAESVG
jgi:hypothetical protein